MTLGQPAHPWRFIPVALDALRATPSDHALRLQVAANFAALGLRTPAAEQLAILRRSVGAVGESVPEGMVSELERIEAVVDAIAPDIVTPEARIARARANLAILTARHQAVELQAAAWERRARTEQWFATTDGNIVRRDASTLTWTRFVDERTAIAGVRSNPLDPTRPFYILGLDPPYLALDLIERFPRADDGWAAPITIIEPDSTALLDALSAADLGKLLAAPRTTCLVGPSALDQLADLLRARTPFQIHGAALLSRPDRREAAARMASILTDSCNRQSEEARTRRASLAARHNGRDTAWWAARFARSNTPLRVLIPTTRYSTYVQHAAHDAAEGFRAAGADARVLIEPDDSTRFSSIAFLREAESWDPDLVVLINYTRSTIARDLPPDVPVVTWVQDAMLHLFSEQSWAARGPHDFLFGHPHTDFFQRLGIPRSRARDSFVPASETKFHPGPVAPDLARRFTCDLAIATNHAETPEQLIERFRRDAGVNQSGRALLAALEPRVRAIAAQASTTAHPLFPRLREAVCQSLQALGLPADPTNIARILDQIVYPLADRILRHETIHWAADLARRRGWAMRIYGKNWDRHPNLAHLAAGPISHDEHLRAAYQCAGVHLHVSLHGHRHQRVVECALSGGLPLARRTRDDVETLRSHTLAVTSRDLEPSHATVDDRALWTWTVDHPASMRLAHQLQRLGLSPSRRIFFSPEAKNPECAARICPDDVAWLMGDLAQTTFDSYEELEGLVTRAIEEPRWRSGLSVGIATRAKSHLTYGHAADCILELVRTGLTDGTPAPKASIAS